MARRIRCPLLILIAMGVCFGALRLGSAEDALSKRVPGTIRILGNPEAVGEFGFARAFPHLHFRRPLWIGYPPDGTNRLFVMEQDGVIHAFKNDPSVRETQIVLDLSAKVYRKHNEEGLLGMAFHPNFKSNRQVFLHYSARGPRRGVVARFKMNRAGTRIDPRSERVILEQKQPWGNHNGGDLQFGPDGYLYLTFGDGGRGGDPLGSGQDLSTWLGAMLRIDVDGALPYRVPGDNPLVDTDGARPEIWAYGLRNVWRFSFDRATDQLWAGDVGQNAWEEIDLIVKGGNYGWNTMEGAHAYRGGQRWPEFIDPVVEHPPSAARSITGGYVYRGARLPLLQGVYLYADYATGNVWGLRHDGTKTVQHRLFGRGGNVSSFGEDAAGEVYFTAFDGYVYTFVRRGQRTAAPFPRRLSETGLFTDTKSLKAHPSLVPYDVAVPLWSDGAGKQRHILLPGTTSVQADAEGNYTFPVGTILVKSFFAGADARSPRLETRLLLKRRQGWAGYTYVWDADQADAVLIDGRRTVALPKAAQQHGLGAQWTFPSRGDCMSCHTSAGDFVLGFRAEQLNLQRSYGGTQRNQLNELRRIGIVPPAANAPGPRWSGTPGSTASRARAYLDVNCSMCHQPGAPGNAMIDLRHDTPLAKMRLVNEQPGQGNLGVRNARLLIPGKASRSILWLRMNRTDADGMPNLAHHVVDAQGTALIRDWINSLR